MTKEEKKLCKKLLKKRLKKQQPFTHNLVSFKVWDFSKSDNHCVMVEYSTYFKPLLYPFIMLIFTPIVFVCCSFNEQESFQALWSDLFLSFRKKRSYTKKITLEEEND